MASFTRDPGVAFMLVYAELTWTKACRLLNDLAMSRS
jgi:hypothetical protein